jgi:hypothetical protein
MARTIMQCLALFQPSDRKLLASELARKDRRDFAIDAIEEFVVRWEQADWLDEGSVSRIGRWLAMYQPPAITGRILEWANSATSAARTALLDGIEDGLHERRRHA